MHRRVLELCAQDGRLGPQSVKNNAEKNDKCFDIAYFSLLLQRIKKEQCPYDTILRILFLLLLLL